MPTFKIIKNLSWPAHAGHPGDEGLSTRRQAKETMGKLASTRSAKSRAASSHSAKQTRRRRIDWAKVDATTEAAIARHAREDRTQPPSDRSWRDMVEQGRVVVVPPVEVDVLV